MEPLYEILAFRLKFSATILKRVSLNVFGYPDTRQSHTFSGAYLLENGAHIHSVKRLEDGTIFTIGDETSAGKLTHITKSDYVAPSGIRLSCYNEVRVNTLLDLCFKLGDSFTITKKDTMNTTAVKAISTAGFGSLVQDTETDQVYIKGNYVDGESWFPVDKYGTKGRRIADTEIGEDKRYIPWKQSMSKGEIGRKKLTPTQSLELVEKTVAQVLPKPAPAYTILSFQYDHRNERFIRLENGRYRSEIGSANSYPLEDLLTDIDLKACNIHSIRRESDDVIFTVGDNIKGTGSSTSYTLEKIEVQGEAIKFCIPSGYIQLASVTKVLPIAKTHAGVDIYEGEYPWVYAPMHETLGIYQWFPEGQGITENYHKELILFSTQKEGLAYLDNLREQSIDEHKDLLEKECLSINDVAKIYSSANNPKYKQSYHLLNLVRSKLNK